MSPVARRWLIRCLKLLVFALLIWGAQQTLAVAYEAFKKEGFDWSRLDTGLLTAAAIVYLIGQLPAALFWLQILRDLDQQPPIYQGLRAHFIGHLGKYVPGKALVVVLRAALIRGPAVTTGAAVTAVFYETFASMAVGSFVALAVLLPAADWTIWTWSGLFRFDPTLRLPAGADPRLAILAAGLTAATGIPAIPAVFRLLLAKLRAVRQSAHRAGDKSVAQQPHAFHIPAMHLLIGLPGMALGWVLMAFSLWLTVRGFGVACPLWTNLPLITACTALALVAGFVSLIPGGAGVRELVFMLILGPLVNYDPILQVLIPIALRVEWLVAEVGIAAILWLIHPRPPASTETLPA